MWQREGGKREGIRNEGGTCLGELSIEGDLDGWLGSDEVCSFSMTNSKKHLL